MSSGGTIADRVARRLQQLGFLSGSGAADGDDEFLRWARTRMGANPSSSSVRGGDAGTAGGGGELEDDGFADGVALSAPALQWNPSQRPQLSLAQAKELLLSAVHAPLSPPNQQELASQLKESLSEDEITACVQPSQLPGLVESNPLVATELLLRLLGGGAAGDGGDAGGAAGAPPRPPADPATAATYLQALSSMELSLQSIDVVNRLTTVSAVLPAEFIHRFITNCIASCENIKDKYMQNRLVRLVCVFLQSLIRNKIVSARDLCVEAQAFCVEFSRIREAAGLYRLIKTLER